MIAKAKLFLLLGFIGLLAQCASIWQNANFSKAPRHLMSLSVGPLGHPTQSTNPTLVFTEGPYNGSNTLGIASYDGETFDEYLFILNATTLSPQFVFTKLDKPFSTYSGKFATSHEGYIASAVVFHDEKGIPQIKVLVQDVNTNTLTAHVITDNKEQDTRYEIHEVFTNELSGIVAYSEARYKERVATSGGLFLGAIEFANMSISTHPFEVVGETATNVICTCKPYSLNALCAWKTKGIVSSSVISLSSKTAQHPMPLFTDNSDRDMNYQLVEIIAAKGFYVILSLRNEGTNTSLVANIPSASHGPTVLRSWSNAAKPVIEGALSYGDLFAVFYNVKDLESQGQNWSYEFYNFDLTPNQTETRFTSLKSENSNSTYSVARSYLDKEINFVAIIYTNSSLGSLWYGELLH